MELSDYEILNFFLKTLTFYLWNLNTSGPFLVKILDCVFRGKKTKDCQFDHHVLNMLSLRIIKTSNYCNMLVNLVILPQIVQRFRLGLIYFYRLNFKFKLSYLAFGSRSMLEVSSESLTLSKLPRINWEFYTSKQAIKDVNIPIRMWY